jgi:hypothetical protein
VDPLTHNYPFYTPYQFAGNKPIWAVDLDGAEELIVTNYLFKKNGTVLKINSAVEMRNGNWTGQRYRDAYFFEGKTDADGNLAYYRDGIADGQAGTAIMAMRKDNKAFFDKLDGKRHVQEEKTIRQIKNGLVVAGGTVAIIATAGAATPGVVGAISVTTGTIAVGGGATKMILDAKGDFDASDKVPTSASEGLIGIPLEHITNDKTGLTRSIPGLIEGGVIVGIGSVSTIADGSAIEKTDKVLGTVNTMVGGNDVKKQIKSVKKDEQNKQSN